MGSPAWIYSAIMIMISADRLCRSAIVVWKDMRGKCSMWQKKRVRMKWVGDGVDQRSIAGYCSPLFSTSKRSISVQYSVSGYFQTRCHHLEAVV